MSDPPVTDTPDPVAREYEIWPSVLGQLLLLFISSMTLDMGMSFRRVLIATMAYWALFAMLSSHRVLSKTDVFLLKYGFFVTGFLVAILGPLFTMLGWWLKAN